MKREERNKLVIKNLGLVYKVAKSLELKMDYEDRIQEGIIGLIKAIEMYNPKRCREFSTYAYIVIRSHIIRAYQNTGNFMRIPVPFHEQYSKIAKVKGFADMDYDKKYDFDYLSKETGIEPKRIKWVIELCQSYSLDIAGFEEAIPDTRKDLDNKLDCKRTIDKIYKSMSNYTDLQKQSFDNVFIKENNISAIDHTHVYRIRKKLRNLFNGVPECIR